MAEHFVGDAVLPAAPFPARRRTDRVAEHAVHAPQPVGNGKDGKPLFHTGLRENAVRDGDGRQQALFRREPLRRERVQKLPLHAARRALEDVYRVLREIHGAAPDLQPQKGEGFPGLQDPAFPFAQRQIFPREESPRRVRQGVQLLPASGADQDIVREAHIKRRARFQKEVQLPQIHVLEKAAQRGAGHNGGAV